MREVAKASFWVCELFCMNHVFPYSKRSWRKQHFKIHVAYSCLFEDLSTLLTVISSFQMYIIWCVIELSFGWELVILHTTPLIHI